MRLADVVIKLNKCVAASGVGKYFKLKNSGASNPRNTSFTIELAAGFSSFLAAAYIIALNATVVSQSGGTCVCSSPELAAGGCLGDTLYSDCLYAIRKDYVISTCLISGIGSILMGVVANLPVVISCGMGLNAYFVFSVVGFHGTGNIPYQTALSAVFLEGIIFIVLTLLGVRQWLAKLMPATLKHATCAGIGMFIAFVGLGQGAGIGLIGSNRDTMVSLSGCTVRNEFGECVSGVMQSPTTWLGIAGLIIITLLNTFRVRGGMLIGIVFVSVISWFRDSPFSYFPDTKIGNEMFSYFSTVVGFHSIKNTLGVINFDFGNSKVWLALATMLYVDILDATGTLYSLASLAGMINDEGTYEGETLGFLCDALAVSLSSFFGLPPATAFIESGVGIAEGGKTGIVAIVVGFFFFISTFFAPIFASLPPWATGPALIVVGSLMARNAAYIPWHLPAHALPAFLTIVIMPLSYSIAHGIISGIFTYFLVAILSKLVVTVSGGRIEPNNYEDQIIELNYNDTTPSNISLLPLGFLALKRDLISPLNLLPLIIKIHLKFNKPLVLDKWQHFSKTIIVNISGAQKL